MIDRPFHETPSTGPAAAIAAQMQGLIPVLTTQRTTLRAPKLEDFAAFAEMLTPPRGQFYGDPQTREEAWAEFMQLNATWLLRGHGAWTVTARDTEEVLGFVQIGAEPGDQEAELGWLLSESAEGQGIAREAAEALKAYAFGTLGFASLVSYVDFENTRSRRLAECLGAARDPKAEALLPADDACCVFRHRQGGHA